MRNQKLNEYAVNMIWNLLYKSKMGFTNIKVKW